MNISLIINCIIRLTGLKWHYIHISKLIIFFSFLSHLLCAMQIDFKYFIFSLLFVAINWINDRFCLICRQNWCLCKMIIKVMYSKKIFLFFYRILLCAVQNIILFLIVIVSVHKWQRMPILSLKSVIQLRFWQIWDFNQIWWTESSFVMKLIK